ncbi:hypothetical protein PDESU_00379 [Pontiella desulfatans]|uniref:SbsA Ig-like domain-containing protein n=2 Tax=Pontiella desulfatans TaxID=2750659 RepID=A0A6C2TWB4_PONDE|nr:hypothetical protein PDESU_00379 [Pontiella desulfatans]
MLLVVSTIIISSKAQTNLTIDTAIKIEFPTISTNAYMLESSSNLSSWTPVWSKWEGGTGNVSTHFFDISDEKLFYRVDSTPRPSLVVSTIPANGSTNVDPATTNLVINFSDDITGGAWSSDLALGERPDWLRNPTWPDRKTCVREFVLESNTQYCVVLNREGLSAGFRSSEGIPMSTYVITFKTY